MVKAIRKKSEEVGISGLNSISSLEAEIMKIVWEKEKISVREVHEVMLKKEIAKKQGGFIPYTTVMSTMTMLAEKGLLKQDKSSKTYLYSANVNRNDLTKNIIKTVANKLLSNKGKESINNFIKKNKNITIKNVDDLINSIK